MATGDAVGGGAIRGNAVRGNTIRGNAVRSNAVRGNTGLAGDGDDDGESDADGDTLLHVLAVSDATALSAELAAEKWQRRIDAANNEGRTPLHLAVMAEMEDAVETLVSAGAGLSLVDVHGNTPLHLCCLQGFDAGFTAIVEARKESENPSDGRPTSPPPVDADADSTDAVNSDAAAYEKSADDLRSTVEKMNFEGNSCAILATLSANVAILEQMKRLSINFNAGDLKSGRTPIHHAVENNDAGLIEYLICECHADINAKCFSDQTPLSLAIDKSFDEIANLLKSLGASDETLN